MLGFSYCFDVILIPFSCFETPCKTQTRSSGFCHTNVVFVRSDSLGGKKACTDCLMMFSNNRGRNKVEKHFPVRNSRSFDGLFVETLFYLFSKNNNIIARNFGQGQWSLNTVFQLLVDMKSEYSYYPNFRIFKSEFKSNSQPDLPNVSDCPDLWIRFFNATN